MNNILHLTATSAWKVLLVSLLLGAGAPAVFAVGVRGLAMGNGTTVDGAAPKPVGKLLAGICFALVLIAVALGLAVIIGAGFGKELTFEHIIPTLVDKKK